MRRKTTTLEVFQGKITLSRNMHNYDMLKVHIDKDQALDSRLPLIRVHDIVAEEL
jgi:hypothetical protein